MSGRRGILSCAGLQGGPTGLTPEMEEFHMMFDKNRKRSIKQHIKYFNLQIEYLLDHPVFSHYNVQGMIEI